MREAALQLRPLLPSDEVVGQAHYLTGRGYWHLSAFAAASLVLKTKGAVQPVFHGDGQLDDEVMAKLRRIFPGAIFVGEQEQRVLLDRHAPAARFPVLHKLWAEFPMFRKLFGVHLWRDGWSLYLDSDILFWRRPDFLLDWFRAPERPICMRDLQDVYGHDREVLEQIVGRAVPSRVNAGLVGLHSAMIDPARLEYFAEKLLAVGGYNHFLEQAMTAMLLAEHSFDHVPPEDYFIPASVAQCSTTAPVCQHYTPVTRGWMYRKGWREVEARVNGTKATA